MNVTDRAYALELDKNDPLAHFKSQFVVTDPEMCYLDGNSLGRLPKETISAVNNLMTEWGSEVLTGWGHWVDEAQPTGDLLGQAALGAGAGQILVCDTTSVNFYQLCLAAVHARPGRHRHCRLGFAQQLRPGAVGVLLCGGGVRHLSLIHI